MDPVASYDRMTAERGQGTTALAISIFLRGLTDRKAVIEHLRALRERDDDEYHSVYLVQMLCWEGRAQEAEQLAVETMLRSGLSPARLVERLGERLNGDRIVRTHFETYGSMPMQNLGFLEHTVQRASGTSYRLVTKLATREYAGSEPLFATAIFLAHPELASVTPAPIDVFQAEDSELCFITMHKVPGEVLVVQDMKAADVDRFLQMYAPVHAVRYADVGHLFPPATPELAHSHAYLVSAMRSCHTAEGLGTVHAWLLESIRTRGYRPEVKQAVEHMVAALERTGFHQRVNPEAHYGLLHGDLHRFNVLRDGDRYSVIDWGRCALGPRAIDLAVLFRRLPYATHIRALERAGIWNELSQENRVLFNYALVLVSVMIDLPNIKEEPADQLFLPATQAVCSALA